MVDENEYRATHRSISKRRCAFEKALLSRRCSCVCSTRFYLADREGVSCDSASMHQRCSEFIRLLRESAKFALKITSLETELPHAKEIKIQNGGLIGLQRVLRPGRRIEHVADIAGLITLGERDYGALEQFPYQEIVQSIASFEGRRHPRNRR
jgi:hypothetical protein